MKKISLNRGEYTLVDDKDFDLVIKTRWYLHESKNGKKYAYANSGNKTSILLHRLIMNPPRGLEVDHINGNGLDNRRKNLRICTHAENNRNKGLQSNNTSGYKGVSWNMGQWCAQVYKNNKRVYSKRFKDIKEAAKAYNTQAIKYYGEFAVLNTI